MPDRKSAKHLACGRLLPKDAAACYPKQVGCYSNSKSGRGGGALERGTVVFVASTGALIGAAIGAYTVGEQTLARDLLAAFGPGMLVLADRNFLCHTLARDVLATGAHILWRASASFRLTPIRVLADGTYLAQLHPRRKADGPPITVRVIEYTVHSSSPDGASADERTPRSCSAWSPTCSRSRPTRRWIWRAPTRCAGAARR